MNELIIERLLKEYARVGADIWGPLLDCLVSARSHFGGDLDLLIIYVLVGLRTLQDPRASSHWSDFGTRDEEVLPSLFTNVRSISGSTGMPCETARRKVARLVELGWMRREGDNLALTSKALSDFTGLREQLLKVVAANYDVVSKLLQRAG